MLIDPNVLKMKLEKDKMRRISKKIMKKKEILSEKKKASNKLRKLNCLYCKKCILIRWSFNFKLLKKRRRRY